MNKQLINDNDPTETKEWLEAFEALTAHQGEERAHYIIEQLLSRAREMGINLPFQTTTQYINTLSSHSQSPYPGDLEIERRIEAHLRWNAMAMVIRAGKYAPDLGGHIATYASSATLYEVGFNHFFKADNEKQRGDLLYIQGHSSPGIYARSYLEGRFNEQQLDKFRQEIGVEGLSSYPHPWLMPDYWQFATVSMGLGPIQGVYQARFLKYLQNRGLLSTAERKVWVFCGDGEMDEPESTGALHIAAKEGLDNLIFVINCNLQRLDGPVRGNGKIIQELEGLFRGAGWQVIKVIWDHHWDTLLAQDEDGLLKRCMMETLDGEYQALKAMNGAYIREHFFGKYPELKNRVAHLSDDEIWHMEFGGHDVRKVYAAYQQAMKPQGKPTVILAKTIKGFGMGPVGQGKNTTHQQKKLSQEDVKGYKLRFNLPLNDKQIEEAAFYKPDEESVEIRYLKEKRKALGGFLPARRQQSSQQLTVPELTFFEKFLQGSEEREISTTMVFVRILNSLLKDKNIKDRIVPIVPDECRTFGMEGMFRQLGIYSHEGQKYKPVDADQLMFYHEEIKGQILEEGITEAGGFCSWLAAATSYSSNDFPMIPFFIYYSMFGFQRIGDLAYAAGDMRARGFLLGGTAGRTTLAGEGLQHQDGQSHVMAGLIPNCVSYDPTYSYELAVIVQDGLRRMFYEQEDIYYYITIMNENYVHPPMPEGAEEGIRKGMYLLKEGKQATHKVQLLGSGSILREVIEAAELLLEFDVSADIWSVTSFNELYREGLDIERWNLLHPNQTPQHCYVAYCLNSRPGPVIAATDYVASYANQIRGFITKPFHALGTDGFGRSDTRENLRYHFEINKAYIAVSALKMLADLNQLENEIVLNAMQKFNVNPEKPNPVKE